MKSTPPALSWLPGGHGIEHATTHVVVNGWMAAVYDHTGLRDKDDHPEGKPYGWAVFPMLNKEHPDAVGDWSTTMEVAKVAAEDELRRLAVTTAPVDPVLQIAMESALQLGTEAAQALPKQQYERPIPREIVREQRSTFIRYAQALLLTREASYFADVVPLADRLRIWVEAAQTPGDQRDRFKALRTAANVMRILEGVGTPSVDKLLEEAVQYLAFYRLPTRNGE